MLRYKNKIEKAEKNHLGNKCVLYIICLSVFLGLSGAFLQISADKPLANMENKIYLLPVGNVKGGILNELKNRLEKTFHCSLEIHEGIKLPPEAYNPSRNQYFSSLILKKLHSFLKPGKQDKVLGIVDVDLYVPGLNFVFGEAELGGHFAAISLWRLRQSFYGFSENRSLFVERTVKEAVHELGHTFGLQHCPDPKCVMHFSNSLFDTDKKSASFCGHCRKKLQEQTKIK